MPGKGRFMMLHPPSPVPFRHGLSNSIEILRVALEYLDVRVESSTLAGSSGVAFRVDWPAAEDRDGSPSAWGFDLSAVCSSDALTAACEPHGWKVLWYRGVSESVAWQFVCQSLERAHPVISYGFLGEPEHTLIVGYDRTEGTRRLSVLTRHADDPLLFPVSERGWPGVDERGICLGLFERVATHRRLSPREAIHRALRRAARQSHTSSERTSSGGFSGLPDYSVWMDDLLARGFPEGAAVTARRVLAAYRIPQILDEDDLQRIGMRHLLHRALGSTAGARRWAGAFLRGPARIFDTGRAAAEYDAEAGILESAAEFWPPVVRSAPGRFQLLPEPDGFMEPERIEETIRCLRIASASQARAGEEIRQALPPVLSGGDREEQGGEGIERGEAP